jgi:hypothetical protein
MILFDIIPGYLFYDSDINMLVFIVTMVIIILLEAWLLWKLNWAGIRKSLLTSILINIFSAFIGFFLQAFFWIRFFPSGDYFSGSSHIHLFIAWLLTIFMEGGVLVLLNLRNWRRGFGSSVLINTASYIFFDVILFGLSILT